MLKKTITYVDYNDVERTEDFYFHLSKADAMRLELSVDGGLTAMIRKIVATKDGPKLMSLFEDMICKAYGEKSDDGRRFIKSPELSKAFTETEAYSQLIMDLITDANEMSEFVNGIIPKDVAEEAKTRANTAAITAS